MIELVSVLNSLRCIYSFGLSFWHWRKSYQNTNSQQGTLHALSLLIILYKIPGRQSRKSPLYKARNWDAGNQEWFEWIRLAEKWPPLNEGIFCYVSPSTVHLCHIANTALNEWEGKYYHLWGTQVIKVLGRKVDAEENVLGGNHRHLGGGLWQGNADRSTVVHTAFQTLSHLQLFLCTKPLFPVVSPLLPNITKSFELTCIIMSLKKSKQSTWNKFNLFSLYFKL